MMREVKLSYIWPVQTCSSVWSVQTCCNLCDVCGESFNKNQNRLRHVRTGAAVHGNEPRKDNEARKDRLIECTDIRTFEEQGVGCDPQVAFKTPKEYVAMSMKAHKDKQLTSDEFMQATELSVFKLITDTFWTALYERPDLYVYITEEMLSWLGFEGECRTQKLHMIQTLNARSIHYIYLSIDDLRKTADQVLEILSEAAALRGRLFVLRPSRPACLGAENPQKNSPKTPLFDQKCSPSHLSIVYIYKG